MSFKIFLNYLKRNFFSVSLLFLSLLINIGSVFYYFFKFNGFIAFISLILALFLSYFFVYFSIYKDSQQGKEAISEIITSSNKKTKPQLFLEVALSILILALFFILFKALFEAGSFSAIASPWFFLPNYFWLMLWSLILALFLNFYLKNSWSYFFIILFYFLFFSVSFFIYKIAFGYDQLLHQRAIFDISKVGLIEPKTVYYIGQYVLELFILKIWPFSLECLDKLLVPFLASVLIPLSFFSNFKKRGFNKVVWPLLLFLILPFYILTYTVPQNLAFLFLIILLLFSFNYFFTTRPINFIFLFSWSLSIFFIHPLAGVPAIIFITLLFVNNFSNLNIFGQSIYFNIKFKKVFKTLAYLGQIGLLPVLLIFSGGRFSALNISWSKWVPKFLGQENIFLNVIYFFSSNKNIWLLILFILATLFVFKKGRKELKIFYYNSVALMSSYFISLFIDFPFLSQIDKSSYASRILILSFLFLLPVFYEMFFCLLRKIKNEKIFVKIILLLFLSALLLSSLYINYPRKDNYFNSRSFSVSSSDFEAVAFIESIKENDNYIVLANQQVGASAIKQYGFKRYYGPWFYYSVQTGGLLYDHYLKMIEYPNKELMKELIDQVGAEGAYFVVNNYWWSFARIVEEARIECDQVYSINNGELMIFYFKP